MFIAGRYSFNQGEETVKKKYPHLLRDIKRMINLVDATKCKIKKSQEKTMSGKLLYSPIALNKSFENHFLKHGWKKQRVKCDYSKEYYVKDYKPKYIRKGAFREMDFIKERLGVEIQFGKYAFMVYNVCAKMTIFNNLGYINTGVEIVPMKKFAREMSTGVSYFEQFVWDLDKRGISDIDIPVYILGIDI